MQEEEGKKFFFAESINYLRGYISATGSTPEELERELKDAIFTAFSNPPRYCFKDLIILNSSLPEANFENKKFMLPLSLVRVYQIFVQLQNNL